jgi:hypothetical protein
MLWLLHPCATPLPHPHLALVHPQLADVSLEEEDVSALQIEDKEQADVDTADQAIYNIVTSKQQMERIWVDALWHEPAVPCLPLPADSGSVEGS